MPVGKVSYKGGIPRIGGGNVAGTLSTLGGRAAARALQPKPDQPMSDAEVLGALAGKMPKRTSQGRKDVAIVKQAPVKTAKAAAPTARVPKRKPS